jgi:cyclopropane-fatty-acyl-phospholipid synthase
LIGERKFGILNGDSMATLNPFYEQVQAHYDLSNEFFALFLDPSMTYSCAYFEREDLTLAQAQQAKIDLSLGKCDLQAGQRLLDIGCGWGATALRAAQQHGVHAIGLTLSRNQHEYASRISKGLRSDSGSVEIRLQGWEEFQQPVDRIVSIGAFEHFRLDRHSAFFERCREILPPDGRMLLHSIVQPTNFELQQRGIVIDHETVMFGKFIRKHIFPGGQLCAPELIKRNAQQAGFAVTMVQSLQPHYARTLDQWASNLVANQQRAVELTSQANFETYLRYLTGCANLFRSGKIDVVQFTLCVE